MTMAFYSRPNSKNYCHFKFKIQVSHSEKLLLGGPKSTLFIHTTWTSANNYPPQYPITHKNSPQLPNYPELPKVTQLPKNNQISLTNINSSRNTTRYPENNPPCSGNNANCLTTTRYLYNTYFYSKFTFARHNTCYTDFVQRRKAVR